MNYTDIVLKEYKPLFDLFDDINNNRLFQGKYETFIYDLPGGRWSSKTYSSERLCLLALFMPTNLHIEIFRYFTKDREEMWKSITEQAYNGNLLEHYTGNKFEFRYGRNKLVCDGVKPTDPNAPIKLGRSQPKCKYKIIWIDEFYEFKQDNWDKLFQALRNYDRLLIIRSTNPWLESNWYVNDCWSNFTPNIEQLKATGSHIVQKDNRIVHWTNALINWKNLPDGIKDQFNHYRDNRPNEARVVCYGLPGVAKGSVFGHLLNKISQAPTPSNIFFGGLDYGYKKDKMIALFGGTDPMYEKLNILDEYCWDNYTQRKKDHEELANDIVDFYIRLSNKHHQIKRGLIIYCDNAEQSFISIVNRVAMQKCLGYQWMSFKPCVKLKIATRTDKLSQLFSESRVNITKECMNLWKELKMYSYDENKKEHTPIDDYNHSIDALCYLLTHNWRRFESKVVNHNNFW